jgi:hypothetical protein
MMQTLHNLWPVAFGLFVFFSVMDGWLTYNAIKYHDLAEGHPLASWLIERLGIEAGIILPKILQIVIVGFISSFDGGWPVAYLTALVFGAVCVWNWRQMRA